MAHLRIDGCREARLTGIATGANVGPMTPSHSKHVRAPNVGRRHAAPSPRKMVTRLFAIGVCLAPLVAPAADISLQAGEANLGRNLAATCAGCHGPGGVSVGEVASLAGKPRDEIVRKMQEFKSGARTSTVMQQLAKGYTDEQILLLAGWFAAQTPAN